MTINYVDNKNPIVGPRVGNKQEISIFDDTLGNRRILSSTPEKIDEYVSKRKDIIETNKKKSVPFLAGSVLASAIPGLVMNFAKDATVKSKALGVTISGCALLASVLSVGLLFQQKQNKEMDALNSDFIAQNK